MSEDRSNPLTLGGYDDEFVDTIEEDWRCVICQLPLKQPIQTKCGHRFCTECLNGHFERLERDGQPLNCPVDREGLSRDKGDIFPDKATERKILSFLVKCRNEGCQWSGELRAKDNHLVSCPLQVVSCTNDNCDVRLQRKDLQAHVTFTCDWRVLHCSHCDVSHPACKTEAHKSECKRLPLKCPNKCEAIVPREEIATHVDNDCPLTIIPCPYAEMGCEEKVHRRKVESHLQSATNLHLNLACAKLNDTRIQLINTQSQLNDTQIQLRDTQLQLRNTQEKVDALESPCLMELINDVHIWKIREFEEKMKQPKSGEKTLIKSPPFYYRGYKLGLTLYPNDATLGPGISVMFSQIKGEFDTAIPWPLREIVKGATITLIDQQENPRQRKNKGILLGLSRGPHDSPFCGSTCSPVLIISHGDLKKGRYVVDDTIFIQFFIMKAQQ